MSRPPVDPDPPETELRLRALGLVDPERADEIDRHARDCPRCGPFLASARSAPPDLDPGDEPAHPPAIQWARWIATPEKLSIAETSSVGEHLSRCAECSADVERFTRAWLRVERTDQWSGRAREATLPTPGMFQHGLGGRVDGFERPARLARSAGSAEAREEAPAEAPRPSARPWLLPLTAAFATAAAVALAFRRFLVERRIAPSSIPTLVPTLERGILYADIRPWFEGAAESDLIDVDVRRAADGRVLAGYSVAWGEFRRRGRLAVTRGAIPLPDGEYLLRLHHRGREQIPLATLEFRLIVKGGG